MNLRGLPAHISLLRPRALLMSLTSHLHRRCQSCTPHLPEMCFLSCPLQTFTSNSNTKWPSTTRLSLRLQVVKASGRIANPHQLDGLPGSVQILVGEPCRCTTIGCPEDAFNLEVLQIWPCPLHHPCFNMVTDPCYHFLGDRGHRRPLAPWELVLGVCELAHACSEATHRWTSCRCGCKAVDLRGHA